MHKIVLTDEEQKKLDAEMDQMLIPVWLARHAFTEWWNGTPIKGGTLDREKLSEALRTVACSHPQRAERPWIKAADRLPEEDNVDPLGRRFSKDVLVKMEGEGPFTYRVAKVRYYYDDEKPPEWWTNGVKVVAWKEID